MSDENLSEAESTKNPGALAGQAEHGRMENAIAIYCTECGADISVCRGDVPDIQPEQVMELWNRRSTTDDLATLVSQLVRALRKAAPEHELPERALDYLKRKGLCGSPLRDTHNAKGNLPLGFHKT